MEVMEVPADDVLLQRPWLPVSISGCQLLAKSWFGETAYRVLLTDMQGMWEERMDTADIQSRAQELNRRLRAPVKAFFSHLCEVVQPYLSGAAGRANREAQISLDRRDDGSVSLRLKSELEGLPFYWEFHCTPAPVALVCVQLVRPLLVMSRLLQRQVDQLGGLLVRKDAEIQDYRENGATLSRERLQTDAFVESMYREDFMAKTLPLLSSEHQDALGFDADLQQLYAAVVAHGNARKRKLSEEDDEPTTVVEEPPAVTSTPASGSVEPADRKPSHNGRGETSRAKMADRPAVQQPSVTSDPAERPTSKPKKKKVGLFR
ncbi:non-homologous end-joining factor 1 [Acanthochromis polyacanthus]|uniref:non-homologous end-joining factor 1 n=1 Tax=Acanthochromis polyacanthus TaxID=80966 RepID=UPI00223427A7|nr:non-homologous end-joining factor 1 [Acanthochromis polyacanthus]XP_051798273.1 non-homologous end-joining factor 1 [Acanthochromis polyacanthus]XP_051798274.1 non-homologous end-joining factor 1 [Acanthochromis polyacanthus]XP_051798275.1 non-homologous end-joining factor 1 [Acanthochromis polyacanthus]